ncbi:hepatic lectin [Xenopus laevis]|uniref:Hepatic lectin n=2 Tax=Xenopus laevis TaxID=8355 RepID=A0A1L8H2I3_XENLA|nr:hepatic lectin [Xenopus laevis]OCT90310.1 hypothetical protein XELAEV_18018922mg [Xenopus laevis]
MTNPTEQRDISNNLPKINKGKYQSHIYEVKFNMELSEPNEKMENPEQQIQENISSQCFRPLEKVKKQKRLLFFLVILLILTFIFLVILTSLVPIYYSVIIQQLKLSDEKKDNIESEIKTIKQTLDKEKANILSNMRNINPSLERPRCDSNWRAFDGSCYYIVRTEMYWAEAQGICKSKNSDLVVINSEKEQKFLESITGNSFFWIGLKRNGKRWKWVDGTLHQVADGFWMIEEPNNLGGDEDCVHMKMKKKWNDIACDARDKAICEKKMTHCV